MIAPRRTAVALLSLLLAAAAAAAPPPAALADGDWLLDAVEARARILADESRREIALDNGLVRRVFRLEPAVACVALDQLVSGASLLRSVRPEAVVTIDGRACTLGGLVGQPNHAFLRPEWLDGMTADPEAWRLAEVRRRDAIAPRLAWKRVRHAAPDATWPPRGVTLTFVFAPPRDDHPLAGVEIAVHHELHDGLPLLAKWLEIRNGTGRAIRIDAVTSEILAAVEPMSFVGGDPASFAPPSIHVETDYAMGGDMQSRTAVAHAVRWGADPLYETQVHYQRQTPCLLEVGPALGPGTTLAPGAVFTSLRTWELLHDADDRERQGLAVRRMYRTIAPWVTENPLMMHIRWSDPERVRLAIDQCADVGFEMAILTFGSGFDAENDDPAYRAQLRALADHAAARGVELGGYSLLASRSIGPDDDVVMPEGLRPAFGHSPCLGSAWGARYFARLRSLFETTGFMLLEHDGSYPGDVCASTDHPGHAGLADSRWTQWRTIADFYGWCRARGVYLNVPDWYYLTGANKCAMGYRETNWSLPRDQQVIHARQNIFDGTWTKTPSMGWMFVPLTEYHGGGAAATIEPLREHLDHYERMLAANLALGVQACWRGPRLYDAPETRELVARWVTWFKTHREILESDLVHGRRADGRDVDWMLHVNPRGRERGMLVAFNPLDREAVRTLAVDAYYTGLRDRARLRRPDGTTEVVALGPRGTLEVAVRIPAGGMAWCVLEAADE